MTWIPTPNSSNIAGFGYNDQSRMLTVEFKNGGRYIDDDSPLDELAAKFKVSKQAMEFRIRNRG